jgi:hypothetical protein
MKKYKITLKQEERLELTALSSKGKHAAQTMLDWTLVYPWSPEIPRKFTHAVQKA